MCVCVLTAVSVPQETAGGAGGSPHAARGAVCCAATCPSQQLWWPVSGTGWSLLCAGNTDRWQNKYMLLYLVGLNRKTSGNNIALWWFVYFFINHLLRHTRTDICFVDVGRLWWNTGLLFTVVWVFSKVCGVWLSGNTRFCSFIGSHSLNKAALKEWLLHSQVNTFWLCYYTFTPKEGQHNFIWHIPWHSHVTFWT